VNSASPEWWADLEYVWRKRVAAQVQIYNHKRKAAYVAARAAVDREAFARAVTYKRSAEWYEHRSRALALARADVLATCGKRWRKTACACGPREQRVGCDLVQLCETCNRKHWRRWRKRITRSMRTHLRASKRAWLKHRRGMPPGIYLITLTGPHSGDLEADRARLGAAWRRLTKDAHAGRWWSTYALTWEATPGADGLGHVHAHVAVISSWVPYEELHASWERAMPGAKVLDVQAPSRRRAEAQSAANYLAKYVTKGCDPREFTGRKAGELLCAFRGKRKVTTSAHFWFKTDPVCTKCRTPHRLTCAPEGLQDIAPGAVLRSRAERVKWWVPRGAPQVSLRFAIVHGHEQKQSIDFIAS
jgi:hypothetical protein